MPTIREVKTELRHREWAEQIQESQSSGITVTAWCKEKVRGFPLWNFKSVNNRNSVVQGKGDQSAHILLTPECGEKRTAETSWIAFAADRTAECLSKRHLHDCCGADTMCCGQR